MRHLYFKNNLKAYGLLNGTIIIIKILISKLINKVRYYNEY